MDGLIPGTVILDEIRAVRDELREFRSDVNAWQLSTAEKIAKLEAQVKPAIVGNGQPSKLATIDTRVTALERGKYWLAGASSASGAAVGIIFELVRKRLGF